MAKWGNGPGWTIDQAMKVLTVLHPAFRENGYALAMHGSVSRDGKGNDLDLIAVPEELCMTPPEEMERMMCDLIGAQPAQQEPNRGLLGTWLRACVLEDGRGIDMEYRLPAPIDRRHEWASSLITLFRDNGYQRGYPASTSTSSAGFGERHRPMRLDGANLDRKGIVRSSASSFGPAARILCASSFRMNSGTAGGRIWDSTHVLSLSISSCCLLSSMLSDRCLNAGRVGRRRSTPHPNASGTNPG
jgi:hypothetical protein